MSADKLTPEEGIVVFDNYCIMCNHIVGMLISIDKQKRLFFTTFQSKAMENISGLEQLPDDSVVFLRDGKKYLRSDAVINIIETLGYPWKVFSVFRFVPFALREKMYSFIARHRYSIFRQKTACNVISSDIKSRYLT